MVESRDLRGDVTFLTEL